MIENLKVLTTVEAENLDFMHSRKLKRDLKIAV